MASDDSSTGTEKRLEHNPKDRPTGQVLLQGLRDGTPLVALVGALGLIYSGLNLPSNSALQTVMVVAGSAILVLASLVSLIPAMRGVLSGEAPPYVSTLADVASTILGATGSFAGSSITSAASAATLEVVKDLFAEKERAVEAEESSSLAYRYERKALLRMSDNLRALGQRATWSLLAGILFASGGVALLFWSSVLSPPPLDNTDSLLAFLRQYGPRLSITIIIELVAFFFLRTYARTLTDIRYVQNEFTNVEMKLIALHTSLERSLDTVTKKALDSLITTERNHVLEKGQTSLEMERERLEGEGFIEGLRAAADIVHGRKDGKSGGTAEPT